MRHPPRDSFSARLDACVPQWLRLLVLASLGLTACEVVHQTAVGSYEVATAPLRLFHHSTPTPTPTPIPPPPTPTPARKAPHQTSPHPKSSASPSPKGTPQPKSQASPSPARKPSPPANKGNAAATSPSQKPAQSLAFPMAKPVPDKPGYVFSPSQPTKYVDVSGYAPGSKVKDPYSGQIFIVP
jgi:hypothetical protein